jgi:hypothetical protein
MAGIYARHGRADTRFKAGQMREARLADARSKDGKMREARPGRCTTQGPAFLRGKAGHLQEAMKGRCAIQGQGNA